MEWTEEKKELKTWEFEKNSVKVVISGVWDDDLPYTLNMEKPITVPYGRGTATAYISSDNNVEVSVSKKVEFLLTYSENLDSLEKAKAKAEELLPLFESVG